MASAAAVAGRRFPGSLRLLLDRRPGRLASPSAVILVSTAALVVLGIVMVLSASSISAYTEYGSSFLFFRRQLLYAGIGIVCFAVAGRMPYARWRDLAAPLLLSSLLLLVLVLVPSIGERAGGAARWIEMGPVTVQPSEFAKLAVIVFAAAMLAARWRRIDDLRALALPLMPLVGLVGALILLQPDLGTAVTLVIAVFVLLFTAGARLKHLIVGALGAGALGFGLIFAEGYRWSRFVSFLNPWSDPQGSGYQSIQSLIALTSGGPFGVGLGASRQKWLYVPNAHTDFIYSIIGEELGLFGNLLVLALFGALIVAGIRIATRAPDAFGRLLGAGIVGLIAVQALVNLGAVTGLLPITGVPLPFVSFGGSSLIVSMTAMGILTSIGRGRRSNATRR
ncbi:MAG: putative lipid II flippase FtsW [Actinomycetota bacterium]